TEVCRGPLAGSARTPDRNAARKFSACPDAGNRSDPAAVGPDRCGSGTECSRSDPDPPRWKTREPETGRRDDSPGNRSRANEPKLAGSDEFANSCKFWFVGPTTITGAIIPPTCFWLTCFPSWRVWSDREHSVPDPQRSGPTAAGSERFPASGHAENFLAAFRSGVLAEPASGPRLTSV